MGNKVLDARFLRAEEPSVRTPVPVQPQPQAVIPPPLNAQRNLSAYSRPLGGAVGPLEHVSLRVRVPLACCTITILQSKREVQG